jgi:hypothetical protein
MHRATDWGTQLTSPQHQQNLQTSRVHGPTELLTKSLQVKPWYVKISEAPHRRQRPRWFRNEMESWAR